MSFNRYERPKLGDCIPKNKLLDLLVELTSNPTEQKKQEERKRLRDSITYALDTGRLKSNIAADRPRKPNELIEIESSLKWLEEEHPYYRHVLEHGDVIIFRSGDDFLRIVHHALTKENLDTIKSQLGQDGYYEFLEQQLIQLGISHEKTLGEVEKLEAENVALKAEVERLKPKHEANKQRGKTVSLKRGLKYS